MCASAWAGSAVGIHDFGPNITENQSCELAKIKATKQLIEDELGQVIQVNDMKICNNDNCNLNTFRWISFPGIIQNSTYTTNIEIQNGRRFCVANITGNVVPIEKHYAQDHNFSATFNQNGRYYDNDHMQIDVYGESRQYYKIFVLNEKAVKIFPNAYEKDLKTQNLTIPSSDYIIRTVKENNPNELVMIISHKQPFKMGSVYNIKDFGDTVMQMKQDGYRIRVYDITIQ